VCSIHKRRGLGVTAAFGVGATYNWADQYFIDVNGDGLLDLVSHGSVLFDHIDSDGVTILKCDHRRIENCPIL